MLRLDTPVTKLTQVSDARSSALKSLGIYSIRDLLNYYPINYLDLTNVSTILDSKIGFNYSIVGDVYKIKEKTTNNNLKIIEITITDKTGTLIVSAFNQRWLLKQINVNDKIVVSGKILFNYGFKRITNPYIHIVDNYEDIKNYAKIISIYKDNENITSNKIKTIIHTAFEYIDMLESYIPQELSKKYKLINYYQALKILHFPKSINELNLAKRSLKYCNLFLQQLYSYVLDNAYLKKNNYNNAMVLECRDTKIKIDKIIETVSLYKDQGKQLIFVCDSHLDELIFYNRLKKANNLFNVTFSIYNQNLINYKQNPNLDCSSVDLLICNINDKLSNIKVNKIGAVFYEEKQKFSKSQLITWTSYFPNCDVIFVTTTPINHNIAKLLYPECTYYTDDKKKNNYVNVEIIDQELYMNAYKLSVSHLQNNGQVIVYLPNLDFKINQISEKIFNGWNIGVIRKNTSYQNKYNELLKFNDGSLDILICCDENIINIDAKKSVLVVVEESYKWKLSNIFKLQSSLSCFGTKATKILLICPLKYKNCVKRLELLYNSASNFKDIDKYNSLLQNIAFSEFKNWGFNRIKLIDLINDTAFIDTANKDAKKYINNMNKYLKYELSRAFND